MPDPRDDIISAMEVGTLTPRPRRRRVLFLSGTTYELPLAPGLARGWDALSRELDVLVLGRAGRCDAEDARFRLLEVPPGRLGRRVFHGRLLAAAVREGRRFRPEVVSAQSPYEAAIGLLARHLLPAPRPKLLAQLHGDWRTASRLYGSTIRRLAAPFADRLAAYALRRSDGTRAVGPFTERLLLEATGEAPLGTYPAYFDLAAFRSEPPHPLPATPSAAWVGALERAKNPAGLAQAWRAVVRRVPSARLTIVGDGPMRALVEGLVRELPESVTAIPRLSPAEVAQVLDRSTLLVLPSHSEGTPRVVMEALARGRAVVASAVGGVPDMLASGQTGLLVPPGDGEALAESLVRLLEDRELAARMGEAAHEASKALDWTPERLAEELAAVVGRLLESDPVDGVAHG